MYYGVRGGPRAGVYNTWDEASSAATGVKGALAKKFTTHADAQVWAASTPPSKKGCVFLDCSYADKDEAKALGAKWDRHTKRWYVPQDVKLTPFVKWLFRNDAPCEPPSVGGSLLPFSDAVDGACAAAGLGVTVSRKRRVQDM